VSDTETPEDAVVLTRLADLSAARLLCGRLASEGIESFLPDERVAAQIWPSSSATGGIRVQVRQADLARAEEILAAPGAAVEDALAPARPDGELDDGTISPGDRRAFRALRVALLTLLLPGVIHPYSLWLAVQALRRDDVTAWGRWRAWVALSVSLVGCTALGLGVCWLVRAAC
jgi:hypothetical protein